MPRRLMQRKPRHERFSPYWRTGLASATIVAATLVGGTAAVAQGQPDEVMVDAASAIHGTYQTDRGRSLKIVAEVGTGAEKVLAAEAATGERARIVIQVVC
jgi:hypothetical protein